MSGVRGFTGVFGLWAGRWRGRVGVVGAGVAVTVAASLVMPVALPAVAAGGSVGPRPGLSTASVAVGSRVARRPASTPTDGAGVTTIDHASWPAAGRAMVDVGAGPTRVGGLPVSVSGLTGSAAQLKALGIGAFNPAVPGGADVTVLDHTVAEQVGVTGVVFTVAAEDGSSPSGVVHLGLDYSGFMNAYGGNFGARLRLVSLPACAVSTPQVAACQVQTGVASLNPGGGTLSADVTLPGGSPAGAATESAEPGSVDSGSGVVVLAATSSASSADGSFGATSLSPASSWSAGGSSGSFTYGYPLRVPASLGGPAPEVVLGYDSGAVDAQTLAQNGQTSWAGEGWDLPTGYIERSYRTCSADGGSTSDLCWYSTYNATMMFGGRSVQLVRDNTSGVWHASDDLALRIEHLTDVSKGNGDNDGEYWKVTTQDGTQYFFGVNKRYATDTAATNAVLTEPVFGNNTGEPCYNATFANAWCQQGYQWFLDYVVDARGNSMTYFYTPFVGHVGVNHAASATSYKISQTLDHIEYGTRAGSEAIATAPMKVLFGHGGRCPAGLSCSLNAVDWANYPDTPWDLYCSSTTSCPSNPSPSHFTPYQLASVSTQVWDTPAGQYRTVDRWDLDHTFPASGDNISPAGNDTSPNLWLQSITHTGYAADGVTSLAEPAVVFGGLPMFNRVDWGNDIGVAPYVHYRLYSIVNGTGGQTVVGYAPTQCDRTFVPVVAQNPFRCFPQYFTPETADPGWGWFHKYVVASVTAKDLTTGSPDEVWSYTYSTAGTSDPSLWHHDIAETTGFGYRTWSQWQGYPTVTVTHGSSGTQTVTRTQYFRGLDNDGMPNATNTAILWGNRRVGAITPPTVADAAAISGVGGRCMITHGGATANGTNIELGDCDGTSNQQFFLQLPSGATSPTGALVHRTSSKCLDIVGSGTANGTNVQLSTCTGAANQVWQRQPDGGWKNPTSGRCLEARAGGTTAGTNIDLWDCAPGAPGLVWLQDMTGAWTAPQAKRCLDITGAVYTNGTAIQNYMCNGAPNQVWQLQPDTTIKNPTSGKCLDLVGSGTHQRHHPATVDLHRRGQPALDRANQRHRQEPGLRAVSGLQRRPVQHHPPVHLGLLHRARPTMGRQHRRRRRLDR